MAQQGSAGSAWCNLEGQEEVFSHYDERVDRPDLTLESSTCEGTGTERTQPRGMDEDAVA